MFGDGGKVGFHQSTKPAPGSGQPSPKARGAAICTAQYTPSLLQTGTKVTSPNSEYGSLDRAYAYFNDALFGGTLPGALITLHDHPRARGYFRRKAFAHRSEAESFTDEICLCPSTHTGRTDHDILSTLVHEMCHLWQFHHGEPPRRCYHDREFATKMEEVGLMPSDTGLVGGRKTGQHMTHYIVAGGPFDVACRELLSTEWQLLWEQPARQVGSTGGLKGTRPPSPKATRRKFTCDTCKMTAQAKPTARLVCGVCLVEMGRSKGRPWRRRHGLNSVHSVAAATMRRIRVPIFVSAWFSSSQFGEVVLVHPVGVDPAYARRR